MRLTVQGLQTGTNYAAQVRAVTPDGQFSEWSEKFTFTSSQNLTVPAAPATVTWTVQGDGFLATWTEVTQDISAKPANISSYELEMTASAVVKTIVIPAQLGMGGNYTLDFATNLALWGTPQPSISLRVRAVNNKGVKGNFSGSINASNPVPANVAGFSGVAGLNSVDLTWTANTDLDLDHYDVFVGTSSGFTPTTGNRVFSGNITHFLYTSTTYSAQYFKIRAIDKFGLASAVDTQAGPYTPLSPFLLDTTAPATPTALAGTITNNANGIGASAAMTWTMSSPPTDLAGFNIRYRPVGATPYSYQTGIDSAARASTIALDMAYQNYEFQIQAYDFSGNQSAFSSTLTVTSPANPTPANVTGLGSTAGKDSIIYTWTPVADKDIANYEVTFSTSPTFASGNITYLTGSSTTLTVGGLNTGTTYYARVRAVDTSGVTSAAFSSTDTKTTGVFPSATSIVLTSTTQVLTSPSGGGTTTPATAVVTGTATGTTISVYDYSVDGAAFSGSVPTGVSRTGNVVTITGSTMTARTIAVRMGDGTISDTMTIAKNFDGATGGTGGTGPAGADAYTVLLTNETQTIPAGTTNALANTFTTNANAYKGAVAQTVTVGTITGGATGITAAVTNNTTTNPLITFTVTTSLATATGSFNIPLTVAGITFTQIWTWSLAFTGSTGSTGPAGASSDGQVPGTGTAPSVMSGLSYLYVTWPAVTTNVLGAAQNDPVTYEVHLSTSSGFTPSGATKVTEVSGTSTVIDILPGTTTALSYGTTYFIKIIAKDRDGSGAPTSTANQGSGQISKVASGDVTSIGADLIIPGTGFANALVVSAAGSIQSSNWNGTTTGYRLTNTGLTILDAGSSIKVDNLTTGTIGSATGVINIGAGASIVMNGGYLKSTTYTGTTQATNPSGAGFYLGNDGIRIDQGIVSASAFSGGTFTAGTINIGSGGSITSTGFTLNNSGLTVTSGSISAAALNIQTGANLAQPQYADFEFNSTYYSVGVLFSGGGSAVIDTTDKQFNSQSLKWTTAAGSIAHLGTSITTDFRTVLNASTTYIFSYYAMIKTGATASTITPSIRHSTAGSFADVNGTGASVPANSTWARYSTTITLPGTATGGAHLFFTSSAATVVYLDGIQVEEKISNSTTPSTWNPPGGTTIHGAMIRTGAIVSSAVATVVQTAPIYDSAGNLTGYGSPVVVNDPNNRPAWSINAAGAAEFSNLAITGNTVLGDPTTTTTTAGVGVLINTTNTSTTIVMNAGAITVNDVGLVITSANLPGGTTIVSITDSTHAVVSNAATVTGSIVAATVFRPIRYTTQMASANYIQGTQGWMVRSDGVAEFLQLRANTISGESIIAGTLSADAIDTGTINADVALAGSFQSVNTLLNIDLNTTSASTTVTTTNGQFYPDQVGATIQGANIPAGATITSYSNATTVIISAAATGTASDPTGQVGNGRNVRIDASGVTLSNGANQAIITLPTNPAASATFTGAITANSIVVQDFFQMQGVNNTLSANSQLTMSTGTYVPGSPPSSFWSYASIHLTNVSGNYSPGGDASVSDPQGFFYDDATKHYYFLTNTIGATMMRFWSPGGAGTPYSQDFTLATYNAFTNTGDDRPMAVSADASNFFFLTRRNTNGQWRLQRVSRTGVFRAGGAVAGDQVSSVTWDETTNNGISSNFPGLFIYGGNTYISKVNSNGKIVVIKYTGVAGLGTTAYSNTTTDVATGVKSMTVGKFDMGGTNIYIVVTAYGATGGRMNYVYRDTGTSIVQSGLNFPTANDVNALGTTWLAATTDTSGGNFQSLDNAGNVYAYTSLGATTTGTALKMSKIWRNDGLTGGTAAVTLEGPVGSVAYRRRGNLTVYAGELIPNSGGNTPNAVGFYIGVDAGTRWRYPDPGTNVGVITVTALQTSHSTAILPVTRTTPVMADGTASIITNQGSVDKLFSVNGQGIVTANAFAKAGTTTITYPTANTNVTKAITFAHAFPASAPVPRIMLTINGVASGTATMKVSVAAGATRSGFTIQFTRSTATDTDIDWLAVAATDP